MPDLDVLKAELIAGHPITGPYNADDNIAADELNAVNRTQNRVIMTGSEVFNAVVKAEFNALSAADQQLVWNILHLGELNPFGLESDIFIDIFGVGSATIAALQTLRKENVSRAVELGFGHVGPVLVIEARNL